MDGPCYLLSSLKDQNFGLQIISTWNSTKLQRDNLECTKSNRKSYESDLRCLHYSFQLYPMWFLLPGVHCNELQFSYFITTKKLIIFMNQVPQKKV
jgi:hypothetical protein